MHPTFDKVHLKFKLNGSYFSHEDLKEVAYSLVKEGQIYERQMGHFLLDWLDDKDYIEVHTSGSTGAPKIIRHAKQAMVNSAIATGNFFNLNPGNTALSCLPCTYIAGKMMMVRAIILGLELDVVTPSLKPQFNTQKRYDFCAMIPLQLQNSLGTIKNIRICIVGGAKVNQNLIDQIQNKPVRIYETFGMTETITHFALKPLNHTEKANSVYFKTLPSVTVAKDDRDCLVVKIPYLYENPLVTNDVVAIHSDTEFSWIGRYDNIINSGGIKVHPEQLETKLQKKMSNRFIITSVSDEEFQEKIVLLIEGEKEPVEDSVFKNLKPFERPKEIYFLPAFVETKSGKVNRTETLNAFKKTSSLIQ